MQFARMFLAPHSTQILRARAMSAAFEMPYAPMLEEPTSPVTDEIKMIEPPPRSAICGSTMLHSQRLLRTLLFIVGHRDRRTEVRVHRRVADEHVDSTPSCECRIHERLQIRSVADVASMRECFPAAFPNRVDDFFACIQMTAGYDDLRTVLCEALGDRPADAATRARHDCDF